MDNNELITRMIKDDEGGWKFTEYDKPTYGGMQWSTLHQVTPEINQIAFKRMARANESLLQRYIIGAYYNLFIKPFDMDDLWEYDRRIIFSCAVNVGVNGATKIIQRSIFGLQADGVLGPKTKAAMHEPNSTFTRDFITNWIEHYINLAVKNPDRYSRYLLGWFRRANNYR